MHPNYYQRKDRKETIELKKLFYPLLFFVLILAACNSSELSISEIQNVPNNVQDKINSDYTLQLVNDGENTAYIIFYSK